MGNKQSFDVLYDKYAPALSGLITKIVNDASLVEKVLYSSFVKAWNQLPAFSPANNSLFTWLLNIARQTAFEEIRSDSYQQKQEKIPKGKSPVYKDSKPGIQKESSFDLVYYKGLNFMEVASALNITLEDVKASIRKAMEKMKQQAII